MLPALGLDHRNLPQTEWLDRLRTASTTHAPDLAWFHEHAPTWLAHELHVREHGPVVAVFEFGPDAALWLADMVKVGRGGRGDGATGEVAQESGAEENGKDGQVLFGVFDSQVSVPGAKSILNTRTEIVRKRHDWTQKKLHSCWYCTHVDYVTYIIQRACSVSNDGPWKTGPDWI